ncbi:MAG: hypothetical protein C4576_33850 [Desulfobacteraceae bacterium]|nr:MAG: hypothetical protein C4576_33850 [Desulfobacteraceae bacterium]
MKTTRREFIVNGSIIAGAAVSGLGLGGCFHPPPQTNAGEVTISKPRRETREGDEKPVLIAYATYCGSTAGVAEAMAKTIIDRGIKCEARLVKDVDSLEGYRAVVVGSAVRAASWWPEALRFVSKNEQTLSRVPVAYFLTCISLYKEAPEQRKMVMAYFDPVLKGSPGVKPVDLACFAGALDYSKMGFIYRAVMKSKMEAKGIPEGDYRNWNAIVAWTESVLPLLTGAPV